LDASDPLVRSRFSNTLNPVAPDVGAAAAQPRRREVARRNLLNPTMLEDFGIGLG
jgi:hypothetical protein